MLNIKDFGAIGHGDTNDTNAFKEAIKNGHEIYIPPGTYLIDESLLLKSDLLIQGSGTLKANKDNIRVFQTPDTPIKNVRIAGITIDGGGQVVDVTNGIKGVYGIYLSDIENVIIDDVKITKCGIMNVEDPYDDNGYAGYGIAAECRVGKIKNIKIINCTIDFIAGGGGVCGDGIMIGGYNVSASVIPEDILIANCSINTAGRHCIAICGSEGEGTDSIAENVRVISNSLTNAQLCGVDIEDGTDIIISENQIIECGKIEYYYEYGEMYPDNYRLRAAIASGTDSDDITISNTIIENCHIGISFGALANKIINVYIKGSVVTDIMQGLANGGKLTIADSQFMSPNACLYYETPDINAQLIVSNTRFTGQVMLSTAYSGIFSNCYFNAAAMGDANHPLVKAAVLVYNPGAENIIFDSCKFEGDATGTGIDVISASFNYETKNFNITNCIFRNLSVGIWIGENNARYWQITNCIFRNIASYGIRNVGAFGYPAIRLVSSNSFINEDLQISTAISIDSSIPQISIIDNYFENVHRGFEMLNIYGGLQVLYDMILKNNLAVNSVIGIEITLALGGNWDRCIVINNNMHGCSTTTISLPAGNFNGFVSENIV